MIVLLDGSLTVEIEFEPNDEGFEDNICLSFTECCEDEEKVFCADEVNLFVTPQQARQLAEMLLNAARESEQNHFE